MATIVTVHGTGATGEESGPKWWQKTSACEAKLREFVEGSDDPLKYEQVIWDGKNSENARREAGRRLFARLLVLERRGEPYVVIGHSHGGSVISFALQLAARRGETLPAMRTWITVGTPFVHPEKKKLLFSRADTITRGMLIAGALLIAALLAQLWSLYGGKLEGTAATMLLALGLYVAGFWGAAKLGPWLEGDKPDWSLPDNREAVDRTFRTRWLQLWHPDDEAIWLLRKAHWRIPNIFPGSVIAGPLLAAFVYGLPFVVIGIAANDALTEAIAGWLAQPDTVYPARISTWFSQFDVAQATLFERVTMVVLAVPVRIARALEALGSVSVPALAVVLFAVTAAVFYLVHLIARGVSLPVSAGLNRITVSQLRGLFFGADLNAENLVGCTVAPPWTLTPMGPLPAPLCAEVTRLSDVAAAKAIGTIRARTNEIIEAPNMKERLERYLTWEELVHTTYFTSPLVLLLIAYAISQTEGFVAKPALLQNANYAQLGEWLAHVRQPQDMLLAQIGLLRRPSLLARIRAALTA
jgi:hypothetical protein